MNKINVKKLLIKVVFGSVVAVLMFGVFNTAFGPTLESINESLIRDYAHVKQLNADQFSRLTSDDVIVFDVREQGEFAVSHLPGAIHLEPTIAPDDFEQRYGALLTDKTAVFYCSVGRRSSKLASVLEDVLEDNGASEFYNLSGGIFQWRNDNRVLVKADNEITQKVHPFNAYWGRLVDDKNAVRDER